MGLEGVGVSTDRGHAPKAVQPPSGGLAVQVEPIAEIKAPICRGSVRLVHEHNTVRDGGRDVWIPATVHWLKGHCPLHERHVQGEDNRDEHQAQEQGKRDGAPTRAKSQALAACENSATAQMCLLHRSGVPVNEESSQDLRQGLEAADGHRTTDDRVRQLLLVPGDEGGAEATSPPLAQKRGKSGQEVGASEQHSTIAQEPPSRVEDADFRRPDSGGAHTLEEKGADGYDHGDVRGA
mmetsp:Transcript_120969/g.258351  ORF Transcript_120969/g.258351 Transcript_120969/m.258351 type:complete len:237 (+) Transcript_120969:1920-2630(+)